MLFLFDKQPSVDSRHLVMLVMSMAFNLLFGLLHTKVVMICERKPSNMNLKKPSRIWWVVSTTSFNTPQSWKNMWTLSSLSWSMSCSNFAISSSERSAASCIASRWAEMTSAAGAAMWSTTVALPATRDPQLQALLGNLSPAIFNQKKLRTIKISEISWLMKKIDK